MCCAPSLKQAGPPREPNRGVRPTRNERDQSNRPCLSVNEDRGQIKHVGGFRQFALRGIAQRKAEWQLVCLTHNRLKLWRAAPAESALDRDHPRDRFTKKTTKTRLPQLQGQVPSAYPRYA